MIQDLTVKPIAIAPIKRARAACAPGQHFAVRHGTGFLLATVGAAALFAAAPGAIAPAHAATITCNAAAPIATSTTGDDYTVAANEECTLQQGVTIRPAATKTGINGSPGGGHTINVNDTIVTTGDDALGVQVVGDKSTVTVGPDGKIQTSGTDRAYALYAEGNENALTNSGTITTSGFTAYGLYAFGNKNTLTNSGTITTSGDFADGLYAVGSENTLTNSGTITVSGKEAYGIAVSGKDNTIINSGLIRVSEPDSFAIRIDAGNPDDKNTITLLPNSRLIGLVQLSSPGNTGAGDETFNFHNRVSTVVTFTTAGGLPETIDTGGQPYLTITPTTGNPYVVVVDPNAFSHADKQLHDLTAGISNSVHAQLDAARVARSRAAGGLRGASHAAQIAADIGDDFAPVADPVADPDVAPAAAPPSDRFRIWAQGFGSHRDVDAQGTYSDASHALYGGILGVDMALDMASLSGLRLGAFAGYSKGDLEIGSGNSQNVGHHSSTVDTDTFFGGVYADYAQEVWYARLILSAGRLDNDSTRLVMDNAPGGNGFWLAKGSYDGMYVSPEVALGADVTVGGMTLMPSVRLRYAHLSLDGYTETGRPTGASASELTVGDRDVNLFGGRVQVAIERSWGAFSVAPRVGVEAYSGDADNVSVTIAGRGLSFAPGGDDDEVTGFIGARLSTNLGGSASLFMDGEAHFGDGNTRYEGRLGAAVHF